MSSFLVENSKEDKFEDSPQKSGSNQRISFLFKAKNNGETVKHIMKIINI